MIILLDTSTMTCRLTIIQGDTWREVAWEAGRGLARGLLRFLDEQTGGIHHISGIGIMRGPGSFTGLRIGCAVANTLAEELGIPIVGSSGDHWRDDCLERLKRAENDTIILPEYGGEAHVTAPRK
ncbi:hypothetical protein GWK74_03940 [Candidatus Saccharibacteria bacterium oral taxon 488]|nr:hypothetical protein GWK74_03940 [Candidatus Saccharibacteria bacterium oral taxon 488]